MAQPAISGRIFPMYGATVCRRSVLIGISADVILVSNIINLSKWNKIHDRYHTWDLCAHKVHRRVICILFVQAKAVEHVCCLVACLLSGVVIF